MKPLDPVKYKRGVWVFSIVVITGAFSGYFMGLRQTGSSLNPTPTVSLAVPKPGGHDESVAGDIHLAKPYSEQDRSKDGPNAAWENSVTKLAQTPVDYSTLTNVTDAERMRALNERASRRAYDGAPPTVPHPIAQDSADSCLACHGPGLVIKDKVASKISHPAYTSCTQCHVPATGPRIPLHAPDLLEPLTENTFVGMNAPLKGSRAWPQAPPTVPHPTLMRDDCLSCHGPQGLFGLRTPHPNRQACVQCHVPGAELDQRFFLSSAQELNPTDHTARVGGE